MKSVPAALTWELFERGRWRLPAAALGALVLPTMILGALSLEGALDPHDPSLLLMHVMMAQLNIALFGCALMSIQAPMTRLYAYPASTARLVTWRLLPAMAVMAVEMVAWTAALNAAFHLNWPLWGPALLAAAAIVGIAAAIWLAEKSLWVVFALTVVATVLGLWMKSRYGALWSDPVRLWDEVRPAEVFTLAGFAAAAYWIAVVGVSRNRRGERPFSLGIVAWLDRMFELAPSSRAFRSPAKAQAWYHWRHGWLMPAAMGLVLLAGLVIWLFFSRDVRDLIEGLLLSSWILTCLALVGGMALGNTSYSDDLVMGQFLATRPMTATDMSRTILGVGARSLLLAWLVWAAAMTIVWAALAASGAALSPWLNSDLGWRQIPLAIVGSWIVLGMTLSAFLTGRSTLLIHLFIAGVAAWVGGSVLAKFALAPEAQKVLGHALAAAFGLMFLVLAAWAFVSARRRGLVSAPTAWAAVATWAALASVGAFGFSAADGLPRSVSLFFLGLLALSVAPLALAPLALAWNRHR
jgi:hypothetical protein